MGHRVLAIDCDMGLQNLDISLGLSDSGAISFLDVCEGGYSLSQAAKHHKFETLSFLTAPLNRTAESVGTDGFRDMVRRAKKEFDYIFLDAPAGIDAGFELAAKYADRCLIVTGADPAAMRDAARAAQRLELMGKTQVQLIVNRVSRRLFSTMSVTVDDVMDTAGLPLIGVVPEDQNVTLAAAFSAPLIAVALLHLAVWEVSLQRHPERFSLRFNAALTCGSCACDHCPTKRPFWPLSKLRK
jgi:septum site-determining protein MinD